MAANKLLKNDVIKLRNNGLTYREIAEKLNCSLSTVKYHCSKNGLQNRRLLISEKDFNLMMEMVENGITQKEISKKMNISVSTIKRYKSTGYDKLKEDRNKKSNYMKDYRKKIKIKSIKYKGGKCQVCGYNKSVRSLGFHHINPKLKDFSISGKNFKWGTIKNELNKCVLICNNCHGEVHEEIDNFGYSNIIKKLGL